MSKEFTVFDIETRPMNAKAIELAKPFDPESVKTGNLGADKAKEKVELSRKAHDDKIKDQAALHPWSAEICAISFHDSWNPEVEPSVMHFKSEADTIRATWHRIREQRADRGFFYWAGKSGRRGFDINFLEYRSWCLGLDIPDFSSTLEHSKSIRNLTNIYLQEAYNEFCSLEMAALRLGCYSDDETLAMKDDFAFEAKDFHLFLDSNDLGRQQQALAYVKNDVRLTMAIANKIAR